MSEDHWEFMDMMDGEGMEPYEVPRTAKGILWAMAIEVAVILLALLVWRIFE
jgi:hypothetical protein